MEPACKTRQFCNLQSSHTGNKYQLITNISNLREYNGPTVFVFFDWIQILKIFRLSLSCDNWESVILKVIKM